MKNLIILISFISFNLSFNSIKFNIANDYQFVKIYNECKYGQCQGIAKSTGNRCKHCVSNSGDKYCYQHK